MTFNYKTVRATWREVKSVLFVLVCAMSVLSLCLMALPRGDQSREPGASELRNQTS